MKTISTHHPTDGTYHNYLAVTGRIDGDDEDSVELFESMTVEQVLDAFQQAMRDSYVDRYGEPLPDYLMVYTNIVLVSESPIHILERPCV